MSISIGHSKTYDWTKGATSNLQHTNITTATASDGWMILAFIAATTSTDWANLTGWTAGGSGTYTCEISPASQLHQSGTYVAANGYAYLLKDGWANGASGDNTCGMFHLAKFNPASTSSSLSDWSGCLVTLLDGTRQHRWNIRSDGTNFDFYTQDDDGAFVKTDGNIPADARFHIVGDYCNNTGDGLVVVCDGIEQTTTGKTLPYTSYVGYTQIDTISRSGQGNFQNWFEWTKYFNSITPYTTTDGTWTSTFDDAIFDAGVGKQWRTLSFDVVANGGTIVVQIRCAPTAALLASAQARFETLPGCRFAHIALFIESQAGADFELLDTMDLLG
jgi:hypothetical protein